MSVDVWDRYGQLSGQHPSTLNGAQRGLVAVCDLRQEVNAGGFDGYFRDWGGNSAEAALAALPVFLGQEWADVLRAAMSLFGPRYPADADARGEAIDQRDLHDRLSALDDDFFALEGSADADERLNAYLRANPI